MSPAQAPDSITETRLQLRRNGYEIIPNLDKRTFFKGWPTVAQDPETVTSWTRKFSRFKATGIRLGNDVAVIDVDVPDEAIADRIYSTFESLLESWGIDINRVPMRGTDVSCKEAWFVRTEEPFNRLHTYRWRADGADPDAPTLCVEIFGGASARQFGAFGAHSVDDAGEVRSRYVWRDEISPLNTAAADLPALSKQQFYELIAAANVIMRDAGLELVEKSQSGEDKASKVYDLTEDMVFQCDDGVDRTLEELRAVDHVRCSASWLEGPEAKRRDRCLVGHDYNGRVQIWETASGTTHCELEAKPVDPFARDWEAVAAKLRKLEKLQAKIEDEDDPEDRYTLIVQQLAEEYAYCPVQMKGVVPINAVELTDGMTLGAFRTLMQPETWYEVGPRGGQVKHNPADGWASVDHRQVVYGIRCEPGQPFPLFMEGARQWVNTYRPPRWDCAGGEADTWDVYLEHLLPDAAERKWFSQWLAYKMAHPGVPGPAVLMVGREQGAGRGTLFDILERYVGSKYVRTVPFSTLTGKTHQAQYNEWQVGSIMAFINESSEATDGSVYQTKHNTYEHLKEVLDPRSRRIEVRVKGRDNYYAMTHTSFIIASNHADALPFSADDRRIAVLQNGPIMSPELAERIHRWKASDANMAALQDWMQAVDLAGYDPYAPPPMFAGKTAMAAANKSGLEEAVEDALEGFTGDLFTREQMEAAVNELVPYGDLPNGWRHGLRNLMQKQFYRVGGRADGNARVKIDGRKYVVYARSSQAATHWENRFDHVRAEVLKNGDPAKPTDVASKLKDGLKKASQHLKVVED